MAVDTVAGCIRSELEKLGASIRLSLPLGEAGEAWRSIEWQRVKRLAARAVGNCLCRHLGCHVYLTDVHGGEPSEGLGGKDIDLVIDCPRGIDAEEARELEASIETVLREWLYKLLGRDPYGFLGIPNIVEMHTTREYLFKKYVEAGAPYVFMLC